MYLFEFEAKKLLEKYGIKVPKSLGLIADDFDDLRNFTFPFVAKAQVLQGKRHEWGGVKVIQNQNDFLEFFSNLRHRQFFQTDELYRGVLMEEIVEQSDDLYLSLYYDKLRNSPVLAISKTAGDFLELVRPDLYKVAINERLENSETELRGKLSEAGFSTFEQNQIVKMASKAVECFLSEDCRLLEINPFRITSKGPVALDAKIILDDRAFHRHKDRIFDYRSTIPGRLITNREKKVAEINLNKQHSGSPCRFVELAGDVATLLSGGGASLEVMDFLYQRGIIPANYSEFSGNPNYEKVYDFTKIVLENRKIKGLIVAGAVANFTQINESIRAIADVLSEIKPDYPIVIRRGGPGEEEAKKYIMNFAAKHKLNIHWYGADKTIQFALNEFIKFYQN